MDNSPFLLGLHCAHLVGNFSQDLQKHYLNLSYKVIIETASFTLMSDNSLNILLSKDKALNQNQYSIVYFTDCLETKKKFLRKQNIYYNPTVIFNCETVHLNIANKIKIYVIEYRSKLKLNHKLIMLNELQPQEHEHYPNNLCGLYGEISFAVRDLKPIIISLNKLGFKTVVDTVGHYPWAILTDGLTIIGLHQTNNFSKPTITYFAVDMLERIQKLKHNTEIKLTNIEGLNQDKAAKIIAPNKLEYFLSSL